MTTGTGAVAAATVMRPPLFPNGERHNTVAVPYLLALALTLAVEVPIYVLALRVARLLPIRRAVVIAVGVNAATHPVVWLVLVHAGSAYWPLFGVVEVGAWLGEAALFLLWVRRDRALIGLTALVANTCSCLAGLLLS